MVVEKGDLDDRLQRVLTAVLEQQQQQGGSSGSTGWLPFLLACCLLAAAGTAVYLTWRQQQLHRWRLLQAADLAAADETRLQQLLGEALPAWVACPDTARVEWMNLLTEQLWPHVERAASKLLLKDGFLESLLNSTSFWRPRMLLGANIKVQAVVLGQVPPRVTGIKAFPQLPGTGAPSEVLLECSFAWASKMEVKLLVTLLGRQQGSGSTGGGGAGRGLRSMLSSASRVKVGVSDLVGRGTVRIALKPLMDEIPVAGGVKVSLLGIPEYHYQINVLGGNPYLVPGVQQWIDAFIAGNVLRPFTFPDGFTYNLVSRELAPTFERPEGLLEVTVVEATGVPRMDLLGKADPYVQLWVREIRKLQTAIKSRTLSPRWNESFTFLVHDSQHQQLNLALFDSDLWRPDDLVGRICVPLSSLDLTLGVVNDLWLPVPRNGKRAYGDSSHSSHSSSREESQRVHVVRMEGGSEAGAAPGSSAPKSVVPREDTAETLSSSSFRRRRVPSPARPAGPVGPAGPAGAAATAAGMEPAPPASSGASASPATQQRSPRSALAQRLQHRSPAVQQLRQLAAAPLDSLRSKPCMLHLTLSFYPLTEQEQAAVTREAHRQQRGEASLGLRLSSTLSNPRVANMLHSGVLYVYLDRASNLVSKTAQGFTRNMKVKVKVGGLKKTTERGKVSFRHRANPVFDETLEVLVDGATAQRPGVTITVEVWVQHFLLPDTFKGRVSIPLQQVIERRRLRDTWNLQDASQGTLTMELSWMGALAL